MSINCRARCVCFSLLSRFSVAQLGISRNTTRTHFTCRTKKNTCLRHLIERCSAREVSPNACPTNHKDSVKPRTNVRQAPDKCPDKCHDFVCVTDNFVPDYMLRFIDMLYKLPKEVQMWEIAFWGLRSKLVICVSVTIL